MQPTTNQPFDFPEAKAWGMLKVDTKAGAGNHALKGMLWHFDYAQCQ